MVEKLIEYKCDIVDMLNNGEIKSIHVNNKLVQLENLNDLMDEMFNVDAKVVVSKKYMTLFKEKKMDIDFIYQTFIESPHRKYILFTNHGKFLDFDMSIHSIYQFMKRFVYSYKTTMFESVLNERTLRWFEENYSSVLKNVLESTEDNVNFDSKIIKILKQKIQLSTGLTEKDVRRGRDLHEFKKRDDKYCNTVRLWSHPFLFVFEDGLLVTVELYSNAVDARNANSVTRSEKEWKGWGLKNLKEDAIKLFEGKL